MTWLISQALFESWRCSQDVAAESSVAFCPDGGPCARSKSTATPQAYSSPDRTMERLPRSLSGMTYGHLTADHGAALLTWYRAGFLVRTSVPQGAALELTEAVQDYGAKWRAWLPTFDPASSSWKTPLAWFPGVWIGFSGIWPRSGMMRDGTCSAAVTLAPRIDGTGYGSLLPTLCATDGSKASHGARFGNGSPKLAAALMMFPTLAARDYRHPNARPYRDRGGRAKGEQLPNVVGGPLNPAWCEWFMGFPPGWTELKPSEMLRFHAWRHMHGTL